MENNKIKFFAISALFAGIICVISPFSINIGIIPISFSTFAIYLIGALSKKWMGLLSTVLFIFIGIIGLPVFSNFTGGIGAILSITGGYIIGYIPCVLIISLITNINKQNIYLYILSMLIGTILCYAIGTLWFMYQTNNNLIESLIITVIPFTVFDIIKIIVATICGYIINNKTPYSELIKSI